MLKLLSLNSAASYPKRIWSAWTNLSLVSMSGLTSMARMLKTSTPMLMNSLLRPKLKLQLMEIL